MATLLLADLHPIGGPEIWSGNGISTSISSLIPIQLDEDGCPLKIQAFPDATSTLKKLTALWDNGIHEWAQILGRDPHGRPYFLDERELQWANPTLRFPLTQKLAQALKFLRALLSSTGWEDWRSKKKKLAGPEIIEPSIAPRWRNVFAPAWESLPDKPSPLTLSRASRQPTITEALRNIPPLPSPPTREGTRIALHFHKRRKKGHTHTQLPKRKHTLTTEPLSENDAPGGNASILRVLARAEPRRVKHNRRFTSVEEFLVQWGPENCTLEEAQEQYTLGFNIEAITSLDEEVPTEHLQPFVSVKRLTTQQRRRFPQPPPTTRCSVQFAPSAQGTAHILSIRGGSAALELFLATEPLPPPPIPRSATYTARDTPIKWSSSAQAPTRTKL